MTLSRQKQNHLNATTNAANSFFSAAPDHAFTTPNALSCRLACGHDTISARLPYLTNQFQGGNLGPSNFAKTRPTKKKNPNSAPNFVDMAPVRTHLLLQP
jgi:hypothetical protein